MSRLLLILGAGLVMGLLLKRLLTAERGPDLRAVPQTDDGVRDLIKMGQKISAIKLYRQIHGVGLKEAKEAVEDMARDL